MFHRSKYAKINLNHNRIEILDRLDWFFYLLPFSKLSSKFFVRGWFKKGLKCISVPSRSHLHISKTKDSFVELGFNWQKVQLKTDLLKHRTQYLYTNGKGWLKLNEMRKAWIKSGSNLIGENLINKQEKDVTSNLREKWTEKF